MSYLVLARKFRPQTFSSIMGQEHITRALSNAILRSRVPHAYLFTGPRGVGKTTSARVLARALNCTGRELPADVKALGDEDARQAVEPCGECANCKEIARSASLAVWEIDGASNNSVDNVRELIESLRTLPPANSRYKIYIIDEVHMLSVAAFNALLKSLEEPPPNTVFIFATTEPHKIPETVISRCQRHDFRRLPLETIVQCLAQIAESESLKVEEGVFEFIARAAEGGMRDAQSMLDRLIAFSGGTLLLETVHQVFGAVAADYFFKQSRAVLNKDLEACFALLDQAFAQTIDHRAFAANFVRHWRNLLLLAHGEESNIGAGVLSRITGLTAGELSELREQLKGKSSFELQQLFDIAQRTAETAVKSNYPRYVLEAGLAKMATLTDLRPLARILSDLEGKTVPFAVAAASAAPAKEEEPKQAGAKPENAQAVEGNGIVQFNPSWENFLAHVKTRKEVLLSALLRRVSPKLFTLGSLEVEADEFDLNALGDSRKSLENCLFSYSGHEVWNVRLIRHNGHMPAENGRKNGVKHLPGSIAAMESQKKAEYRTQIEKEVRSDPLVKATLAAFEGSKIEKIVLLQPLPREES